MKSRRFITAMLVVMMSGGVAVGAKEKPQISDTLKANCLVKITSEPGILPLNFEIVESVVLSSGVAVKAAREILDASGESIDRGVKIEISPLSSATTGKTKPGGRFMMPGGGMPPGSEMMMMRGSGGGGGGIGGGGMMGGGGFGGRMVTTPTPTVADEGTYFFRLSVELGDDVKPAAEELMKAVVANLRRTFDNAYVERLKQIEQQLTISEDSVKGAQAELSIAMGKTTTTVDLETQKELEKLMRKVQMQPSMEMLVAKKYDLLMSMANGERDVARMDARRQAIENQILKTRKEMANLTANDVVIGELEIIVEISRKRAKTVEKLVEAGKTSADKLENAVEKLARARIELAEQSRRISDSAGGGQLNDFNKDLADLAIQLAESGAEVRFIYDRLGLVEHQLKEAATVNPQLHKIKSAQARLEEATSRVNALKRQLAGLVRPTVTILSAE